MTTTALGSPTTTPTPTVPALTGSRIPSNVHWVNGTLHADAINKTNPKNPTTFPVAVDGDLLRKIVNGHNANVATLPPGKPVKSTILRDAFDDNTLIGAPSLTTVGCLTVSTILVYAVVVLAWGGQHLVDFGLSPVHFYRIPATLAIVDVLLRIARSYHLHAMDPDKLARKLMRSHGIEVSLAWDAAQPHTSRYMRAWFKEADRSDDDLAGFFDRAEAMNTTEGKARHLLRVSADPALRADATAELQRIEDIAVTEESRANTAQQEAKEVSEQVRRLALEAEAQDVHRDLLTAATRLDAMSPPTLHGDIDTELARA